MIYEKTPIPWNPAKEPSMIYEEILISWKLI
mgnify:CR=1 FL=1